MIDPRHLNNLLKTFEKSISRLSGEEFMTKEKMVEWVGKNVTKKSSNMGFGSQSDSGYRQVSDDPKDITIGSIDNNVAKQIMDHAKSTGATVNIKNKKGKTISESEFKTPDFNVSFPSISFLLPAVSFPFASAAGFAADFLQGIGDDYDERKKKKQAAEKQKQEDNDKKKKQKQDQKKAETEAKNRRRASLAAEQARIKQENERAKQLKKDQKDREKLQNQQAKKEAAARKQEARELKQKMNADDRARKIAAARKAADARVAKYKAELQRLKTEQNIRLQQQNAKIQELRNQLKAKRSVILPPRQAQTPSFTPKQLENLYKDNPNLRPGKSPLPSPETGRPGVPLASSAGTPVSRTGPGQKIKDIFQTDLFKGPTNAIRGQRLRALQSLRAQGPGGRAAARSLLGASRSASTAFRAGSKALGPLMVVAEAALIAELQYRINEASKSEDPAALQSMFDSLEDRMIQARDPKWFGKEFFGSGVLAEVWNGISNGPEAIQLMANAGTLFQKYQSQFQGYANQRAMQNFNRNAASTQSFAMQAAGLLTSPEFPQGIMSQNRGIFRDPTKSEFIPYDGIGEKNQKALDSITAIMSDDTFQLLRKADIASSQFAGDWKGIQSSLSEWSDTFNAGEWFNVNQNWTSIAGPSTRRKVREISEASKMFSHNFFTGSTGFPKQSIWDSGSHYDPYGGSPFLKDGVYSPEQHLKFLMGVADQEPYWPDGLDKNLNFLKTFNDIRTKFTVGQELEKPDWDDFIYSRTMPNPAWDVPGIPNRWKDYYKETERKRIEGQQRQYKMPMYWGSSYATFNAAPTSKEAYGAHEDGVRIYPVGGKKIFDEGFYRGLNKLYFHPQWRIDSRESRIGRGGKSVPKGDSYDYDRFVKEFGPPEMKYIPKSVRPPGSQRGFAGEYGTGGMWVDVDRYEPELNRYNKIKEITESLGVDEVNPQLAEMHDVLKIATERYQGLPELQKKYRSSIEQSILSLAKDIHDSKFGTTNVFNLNTDTQTPFDDSEISENLSTMTDKLERSIAADMEALSKLPTEGTFAGGAYNDFGRGDLQKSLESKRSRLAQYKQLIRRDAPSVKPGVAGMDSMTGLINQSGKAYSSLTVGNKKLDYSLNVKATDAEIYNDDLILINDCVREIMQTSEDAAMMFQRLKQFNDSLPDEIQVNLNTINYVNVDPPAIEYGSPSSVKMINN